MKNKSNSKKIYYIIDKSYFLFTSNFYNPLIGIIEEEVQKEGYEFQFTTIDSVEQLMMKIDLNDIAGIIMTSSYIEELIPALNLYNIPFVLVDSYLPLEDTSAVITDNIGGVLKAVRHLAERGHERIGYLQGEMEDIDCVDRLTGYKRGLEMNGLPFCSEFVRLDLNMSILPGDDAIPQRMRRLADSIHRSKRHRDHRSHASDQGFRPAGSAGYQLHRIRRHRSRERSRAPAYDCPCR